MKIPCTLLIAASLFVAACSTLSTEDRHRLTLHLENAAQYYDQRHYEPAFQQWAKALEYDPTNSKARLGQAMVLYFLGLEESPQGPERLTLAEERLGELRHENLDGLESRAELGYALVQDRWVSLLARKIRQLDYKRETEGGLGEADREQLDVAHRELGRRALDAETSYSTVFAAGEQEAQYQLTCMVGLAKMAAFRGDYKTSLGYARDYEKQIERSKKLWTDAVERYPREASLWEQKLAGAERQEAELRDLMANVLFKLGRLDEAEDELTKVVQLDSARESAFLNRGIVRQEREDWDRARQDLRTFLAMTSRPADDPSVVEARTRLAVVEKRVREEDDAALKGVRPGS